MPPQILNIRTFAVKFLSAAAAVGSGLPVGPEGPMIHMGAIVGAGLSQGHSTTLGIDSGLFRRFQVGAAPPPPPSLCSCGYFKSRMCFVTAL